jgi:hypothetical protein
MRDSPGSIDGTGEEAIATWGIRGSIGTSLDRVLKIGVFIMLERRLLLSVIVLDTVFGVWVVCSVGARALFDISVETGSGRTEDT